MIALNVYGGEKFSDEFKYCCDRIEEVCNTGEAEKLKDIIFTGRNTNSYPSVFAAMLIAFHEIIVGGQKKIADYAGLKQAIRGLYDRLDTSRKSTPPDARRTNINVIKGLVQGFFVDHDIASEIYEGHASADIKATIVRSQAETSFYELKQGILTLSDKREIDPNIISKLCKTACAMANNGPGRAGAILIGVADKEADIARISDLDNVEGVAVGFRRVVGVAREAKILGKSIEDFHGFICNEIKKSDLSSPLKEGVLSGIDYNEFYGLGVLIISIPEQTEPSFFDGNLYWREGDATVQATDAITISSVTRRF